MVPPLARLGDLVGHKKVLLLSTAVTALGSWMLGVRAVLHHVPDRLGGPGRVRRVAAARGRDHPPPRPTGTGRQALLTRRAAAILVGALELAVIIGALTSGALVEATSMAFLLALPAIVVTVVFFVIWFGIEDVPGEATGGFDWGGLALITVALGLVMGGLVAIRVQGPDRVARLGAGRCSAWPRSCRSSATRPRHPEPMVDVRLLAHARPVAGAADRVPVRHVGARRADPAVDVRPHRPGRRRLRARRGRDVRVDPDRRLRRLPGDRRVHAAADLAAARARAARWSLGALLVALGYALWLPFHDSTWQALVNMAVAGLGSGALVAALPATAAAAAPPERTGFATGMTNATKTIGGAIASAIFAIALAGDRLDRGPGRGPRPAVGLPHGLGDLRGRRPARGRGAAADAAPRRPLDASAGSTADRWHPRRLYLGGMPESEDWPEAAPSEPSERPARGRPDRQGRRGARMEQQQTWVDLQVRQAMERGDFDDLPGAGKPIEDLGEQHDPDWWIKKLVEREQIAVLPPSLRCARRTPSSTHRSTSSTREADVRREVEDFNERVVAARYRPPRAAADHHAARRRRDRRGLARAPYGPAGRAAPQGAASAAASAARRRRWRRRRLVGRRILHRVNLRCPG